MIMINGIKKTNKQTVASLYNLTLGSEFFRDSLFLAGA